MVQELSQDNLENLVANNKKVAVQFSATWCGNCRIMKPKFKKLASENEEITFVVVDAEKFPESRKLADVSKLPTFATFVDGKFVNQVQTNKFDSLKELINEVKEVKEIV
ncbi:thioredoxin family protein [Tenacibaculum finnmarkense]|uniref:Thioredoxin n=1 Tax=Tenacibaculum finnmarkense genomovar finnmarkense TaxID=1458503 RepID=A0AAP1RE11_9FLAO|nr:thioredoxin family protein [Tenacibaculum finnmarkense]MBE7652239.1 thioredoxin [Tenacibaculum finnmarkense genomovar finnmarkense]MBE7694589.1 thioredoxin [Tenacibaculum finnmarkense genomovar finnmarkense]MCD8426777.1 thioredoxin family protein [Tenacibaculum finnmarkense genomovar finnmarkense]MCG8730562.1 thioredoxin family protein [Tenacibaculum finnmarkense]MCG8750931.1 thioredoxin family protein [Tenacibaculum finnmarkense]